PNTGSPILSRRCHEHDTAYFTLQLFSVTPVSRCPEIRSSWFTHATLGRLRQARDCSGTDRQRQNPRGQRPRCLSRLYRKPCIGIAVPIRTTPGHESLGHDASSQYPKSLALRILSEPALLSSTGHCSCVLPQFD